MKQFSTSAGRDEWLVALVGAFAAASKPSAPRTVDMLLDVERHLRDNARATVMGSRQIH